MTSDQCTPWSYGSKSFRLGIKQCLLSGILILVPFTVMLLVIFWLLGWLRKFLRPLVAQLLSAFMGLPGAGDVSPVYLKALVFSIAVLMLLVILYLVGMIGTRVVGKRLLALAEALIKRVPVAGTLYGASKQVVDTFGANDKPGYKSVVLVEFPRPGCKSVGFLTGFVTLPGDRRYAKVFIPTAPNPTTGYFELIVADEIEELSLSVEDTFKMILSVGLVSPEHLEISPKSNDAT
jgi:uncharacterized membrane protein